MGTTCKRCKGIGWIKAWFRPGYNLCSYCGGTGTVAEPPKPLDRPRGGEAA